MNPWPIYEEMKKHFRKTRTILTEQEIRWKLPGATDEEIREGIAEFSEAHRYSFQHETFDFDDMPDDWITELIKEIEEERGKPA